jgi:hypothetical protein
MGLTGLDSGQSWYVSMQCAGGQHYNLETNNLADENNFALAA